MTTGRINQVTTFTITKYSDSSRPPFFVGVRFSLIQIFPTWDLQRTFPQGSLSASGSEPPCPPISHSSDTLHPVSFINKNHCLLRELPVTSLTPPQRGSLDHGGFSSVLIATRLGHRQVVHISPPCSLCKHLMCLTF